VAQGRPAASIQGSWEITAHTPTGKIQIMLSMPDNQRMSGTSFEDLSTFRIRGLTSVQIAAPVRTAARFEIVRESGTFECEGYFESGNGSGTFVLRLDPEFFPQMASLGFPNTPEKQVVSIVFYEAGPRYLGELRSTGLAVPTFDQLIGMRVLGVNSDFIRSIQQAGYTPSANELTGMWVNGVAAAFVHEVQQLYPSVSLTELTGMKVMGVSLDFAREIRQMFPSVSVNDLIGMKSQGVMADFAREIRQSDRSISINDLIGMRIFGTRIGREMRQINPSPSVAPPQTDGRRSWAIEPALGLNRTPLPDRIQLVFFNPSGAGGGMTSNSVGFDPSMFRGLTAAQMASPIKG